MNVDIRREDVRSMRAYASIPSSFDVRAVVDVEAMRLGESTVPTRAIGSQWVKSYDAIPGNDPVSWATRYDVRSWIHLAAYVDTSRVGGAIVVTDPASVAELGGGAGGAVLWDLRVAPSSRRRGIGRTLLAAAEDAARFAGCSMLDVETQDINVAACRLYGDNGYVLTAVSPDAYSDAPGETRLLWSKRL